MPVTRTAADGGPGWSAAPHPVAPARRLDPAQRAAVDFDGPALLVLGAPGTGKTTVAQECAARVARTLGRAGGCLVLTAARTASESLRSRLLLRTGATTSEPLSRTVAGLAVAILAEDATRHGEPAPQLISGAEQDALLRDLLAGHLEGVGRTPDWPDDLSAARTTAGFRAELRDLLMRAVEHDVDAAQLRALGERTGRPAWGAAATVLQEYQEVLALARPGSLDPAGLCGRAAEVVAGDEVLQARLRKRWRCLVVDDAQELTAPAMRLLAVLAQGTTRLVVIADPDIATDSFRGADPRHAQRLVALIDDAAPTVVLGTAWRQRGVLRAVTGAVAARIGATWGGEHRKAVARDASAPPVGRPSADLPPRPSRVQGRIVASAQAQLDDLANTLRIDHFIDGVAWSELAAITRTATAASDVRAALIRRGIPVEVVGERPHLPAEPAVAALLTILRIATDRARGSDQLCPERVEGLLRSPFGVADPLAWRRLKRTARAVAGGQRVQGSRSTNSDADVVAVIAGWLTDRLPPEIRRSHPGVARIAAMIAAASTAAVWDDRAHRWGRHVSAAGVLWAAWSASGVADLWRDRALGQGAVGAQADRDLDAVLALFEAADGFDEYGADSGPDRFADHLEHLEFTAAPRTPALGGDCVEVMTVHAAVGRSWRRVTVLQVQEGIWPNLRARGSLLGAEQLVDVVCGGDFGPRSRHAALRADETRLFHVAVSRASEVLRISAVEGEDDVPSSLFHVATRVPGTEVDRCDDRLTDEHNPTAGEFTLSGVTATLRRMAVLAEDPRMRAGAARRLAALAAAGVCGADPDQWWDPSCASDGRPLGGDGGHVGVSPSDLDDLAHCPLRWLARSVGGQRPRPAGGERVGEVVHAVLAERRGDDPDTLLRDLDRVWPTLGIAPGWLERRARADAEGMVVRAARYLHWARDNGLRETAREVSVTAHLPGCTITARCDRLEEDAQGRTRVVDYKTGATKPTSAQVRTSPQLAAYQLAVAAETGPDTVSGAALVQLGRASNHQVTIQEQPAVAAAEDPGWAQAMIRASAQTMAGARFEARPGSWCRSCDVAGACPAPLRR